MEGWLWGQRAAGSRGAGVPRLGRKRKAVRQEVLPVPLALGIQCCVPCAWFERVQPNKPRRTGTFSWCGRKRGNWGANGANP